MTNVIEEAARAYETETGIRVRTRIGSSGILAVEIENGAPADVFVSAHVDWMDRLRDKGLIAPGARVLAWNTIAVIVLANARRGPVTPCSLRNMDRVAIGDPGVVPAGTYARQST